jgi:hypothetical protein
MAAVGPPAGHIAEIALGQLADQFPLRVTQLYRTAAKEIDAGRVGVVGRKDGAAAEITHR